MNATAVRSIWNFGDTPGDKRFLGTGLKTAFFDDSVRLSLMSKEFPFFLSSFLFSFFC